MSLSSNFDFLKQFGILFASSQNIWAKYFPKFFAKVGQKLARIKFQFVKEIGVCRKKPLQGAH